MARIVVGVDGSPHAQRALKWAIEEARLRDATVEAVFVIAPFAIPVDPTVLNAAIEEVHKGALAELEEAVALAVDGVEAGVEVEQRVIEGAPANTLVRTAQGADLLVVGTRGRGGFRGLLLGSVSQQCATHATCPVVIMPVNSD
jgi:nucleotide-binding universal stress UspA family protein